MRELRLGDERERRMTKLMRWMRFCYLIWSFCSYLFLSVSLSLAIYQTAGNSESYMSAGLGHWTSAPLEHRSLSGANKSKTFIGERKIFLYRQPGKIFSLNKFHMGGKRLSQQVLLWGQQRKSVYQQTKYKQWKQKESILQLSASLTDFSTDEKERE